MADLDDFFAKKDRKKSKSTKKFSTTEEVAKKLEDTAKKGSTLDVKAKKDRVVVNPVNQQGEATEETPSSVEHQQDQDEWRDFEEEKKDYSGLKIGNLQIGGQSDGSGVGGGNSAGGGAQENQENQANYEEGSSENDRKVGPWKRIDAEEGGIVKKQEAPPPPPTLPSGTVRSGAYVPPVMRSHQQQQSQQQSRMRSKAAPDIHNEDYFPTLSKMGEKKNRNEEAFEVVAHSRSSSHRQAENSKLNASQGHKLTLDNRYGTLSNDS